MSRITLITEAQAEGRVKEIYQEIKTTMGWNFVPQTFQLIAHNPAHLESYWAHYQQAMAPGRLDLPTKKLIAYLVSAMNHCAA